jgi:hypothetical protein
MRREARVRKPDRDFSSVLAEFAGLSSADQHAVASLLSAEERQTLQRLLARSAKGPERDARRPQGQGELSDYSPWLAKRLLRYVDPAGQSGSPGLTQATQKALADLLARQHAR